MLMIRGVCDADLLKQIRDRLGDCAWRDGRETAGDVAARVKRNLQVPVEDPVGRQLGDLLRIRLMQNAEFLAAALPLHVLRPRFNRHADGGYYGPHVDAPVMQQSDVALPFRVDLSATIFLSDPDAYEGGELRVHDAGGERCFKGEAGDMVLYRSGHLHEVTPVKRGVRVAAFFWLQSLVPNAEVREHLWALDGSIRRLSAMLGATHDEVLALSRIYNQWLREATRC